MGLGSNELSSIHYYHKLRKARFARSLRGGARFFKGLNLAIEEMLESKGSTLLILEPHASESVVSTQSTDQGIVKEGEYMMFVIARHRDSIIAQQQGLDVDVEANTEEGAVILGTIPDSTPEERCSGSVNGAAEDCFYVHYPHRFGCPLQEACLLQ